MPRLLNLSSRLRYGVNKLATPTNIATYPPNSRTASMNNVGEVRKYEPTGRPPTAV